VKDPYSWEAIGDSLRLLHSVHVSLYKADNVAFDAMVYKDPEKLVYWQKVVADKLDSLGAFAVRPEPANLMEGL